METNQEFGTVSNKDLEAGTPESSSCEAPVINETTLVGYQENITQNKLFQSRIWEGLFFKLQGF